MLEYFYREDDQEIFSGRKDELSRMEGYLLSGKPVDVHISGLRRIGKTMLIKEFMKRRLNDENKIYVYINLEEISETPEDFALKYIGWHMYWYYAKGSRLPAAYLHLPSLIFEVQDKELRDEHPLWPRYRSRPRDAVCPSRRLPPLRQGEIVHGA